MYEQCIFKLSTEEKRKSGTGEGSFTGRDQQTAEGLPDSGNREKAGKYLAASGWNQRVRAAERCVLDLLYEMIGERVAPGKESYCFCFMECMMFQ